MLKACCAKNRNIFPLLLFFVLISISLVPLIFILLRGIYTPTEPVAQIQNTYRLTEIWFFTLAQAFLSAFISLLLALPGAIFIANYSFPGRKLLLGLSILPLGLPPILMLLGFIQFYGVSGYINTLLMSIFNLKEAPLPSLYSFWGLIFVQGVYEYPLVQLLIASALQSLLPQREFTLRMLGAGKIRAFMHSSFPTILPSVISAFGIAFLLCYFSFIIVLLLGGLEGTTMEVAIYRMAWLDSDINSASRLAALQFCTALVILFLLGLVEKKRNTQTLVELKPIVKKPGKKISIIIVTYIICIIFVLILPLFTIVISAFTITDSKQGIGLSLLNFSKVLFGQEARIAKALLHTVLMALPSAFVATILGGLGAFLLRQKSVFLQTLANMPLAFSGIITSLGWILLFPGGGPFLIPVVLGIGISSFVYKICLARLRVISKTSSDMARSLGAKRWQAIFYLEIRAILPIIFISFVFSFAIAANDSTVVFALSNGSFEPLTLLLYRLFAFRHTGEASVVALILALLSLFFFILYSKGSYLGKNTEYQKKL